MITNNNFYDFIVIGGGPAGSIFTKELANNKKIKILLIDGQNTKSSKVCGGLLSPDAQKILLKLNLTLPTSVLDDPQIFDVMTIDLNKECNKFYQRHYLNMDRQKFDKWLLSLIPDNVTICNGRCIKIENSNDVKKITIKIDNNELTVIGKYIIGADGSNSIVKKTFFKKNISKYVAIQQYFINNNNYFPPYSCIFDSVTSPSCSWTIKKGNYLIYGGAFDKKNCHNQFEIQKKRFEKYIGYSLGTPIKTESCFVTSPRKITDFTFGNNNIFLIGEAAGFISSSSFEGISYAMLSGKILADCFIKYTNNNILKKYKKKCLSMCLKLYCKILKRKILFNQFLRFIIMKSGIKSIKKY